MRRALLLAGMGRGRVEPNPMVGAVVTAEGRIVGFGHHARYGGPHAEAAALAAAGDRAKGATVHVTLEPCAHHGKTPPCAEALVQAGVARVVYGAADPNPLTAGRGPARLREAGVEVAGGVLEDECRALNRRVEAHLSSDRPWVIAKWAMSLDGKIADERGASRSITGHAARRVAHEIRGAADAVVVGAGTARADDPDLRPRGVAVLRRPVRVVVDSGASLSLDSALVRTAREWPALVAAVETAGPERVAALEAAGVRVLRLPAGPGGVDLAALFRALKAEGIGRVLLEGGGELHAAALRAALVDQVMAFVAPIVLGGRGAPAPVMGEGVAAIASPIRLDELRVRSLPPDLLLEGYPVTARRS